MGEKVVGEGKLAKQAPFRFTVQESFDVGCDTVTPVSEQYETPFQFTGKINRVVVDVGETAFEELAAEAKAAMGKIAMGDAIDRRMPRFAKPRHAMSLSPPPWRFIPTNHPPGSTAR